MTKTLRSTTRTLLAAFAALAMSSSAATALAQSGGITMNDAERIALEHFPGATVESVERDVERRVEVYEVELRDEHGIEHELVLDAHDGHVIRTETDDD